MKQIYVIQNPRFISRRCVPLASSSDSLVSFQLLLWRRVSVCLFGLPSPSASFPVVLQRLHSCLHFRGCREGSDVPLLDDGDGDGLVSSAVCQHKQHWRPAGGWCGHDRGQEYLQLSQMKRWSQVSICLLIKRILSQEIMV